MNTLSNNQSESVTGGILYDGALANYTVLPNEDLNAIAKKFGTKVGVLLELNPRIGDQLTVRPGQVILVPAK